MPFMAGRGAWPPALSRPRVFRVYRSADGRLRCRVAGATIEIGGSLRASGNGVVLGIRPEDLYELPAPAGLGPIAEIAVRVIAVEPLGAETLLVLASADGSQEFIARVGRQTRLAPGDRTIIGLDTARVHLFDAATTKAISNGSS
jgi:ABC-type sugar transport system ATPase subunit